MRYEDDFDGQDDAYDMMGAVQGADVVGGNDLVGAAAMSALGMYSAGVNNANTARPMIPRNPAQHPAVAQFDSMVNDSLSRAAAAEHASHMNVQLQLARAKNLPQVALPVDSVTVATLTNGLVLTGTTVNITPSSSVPLRITFFTVAESCAQFFNVTQVTISRLAWNVGAAGIPAENFIQNATTPPMENAILPAGAQAIVGVNNVDGASQRFRGNFYGIDLTPQAARSLG